VELKQPIKPQYHKGITSNKISRAIRRCMDSEEKNTDSRYHVDKSGGKNKDNVAEHIIY